MQISIVICHHTGRLIDGCLASIAKTKGLSYEIIIVSSDPSYSISRDTLELFPSRTRLKLIQKEAGPAEKRNIGVSYARAGLVAFLDDDLEVTPQTCRALYDFLSRTPQCAMVFSKILKMDRHDILDDAGSWLTPTGFLWARSGNDVPDTGQFDFPVRCLASKSACCAVRLDAFYEVKGFDIDYYILGEETDLAWRLWLRGWEVWFTPNAVSYHAFDTPLKPKADYYTLERIHFHGCKNYLSLLFTNLSNQRLLYYAVPHLSAWCAAALGFAARGHFQRSRQIMRGLFWFFRNLPLLRRKRLQVQRERQVSERKLMRMVLCYPPISYYTGRLWRYLRQALHG